MMGVGNVTELTHADTIGMNALLFGIASELRLAAVLVVQVSEHARSVVREADVARRIMYAARSESALPKDFSPALLALHEKRPFPHTPADIAEIAAAVRDPSSRRDARRRWRALFQSRATATIAPPATVRALAAARARARRGARLLPGRGVCPARRSRGQLGKRYAQDSELGWGAAVPDHPTISRGRVPRAPRSRTSGAGAADGSGADE